MTDRAQLWDKWILPWEQKRYSAPPARRPFKRLQYLSKSSLRERRSLCLIFLDQIVKGQKVLELGAGSAQLALDLLDRGATFYTGVDFAPSAIAEGKKSLSGQKVELLCRSLADVRPEDFDHDIIFSLGLTDWINLSELRHLLALSQGKFFLHSFSLKRPGLGRLIHMIFSRISYAKSYRPKYYPVDDILQFSRQLKLSGARIVSNPRLQFGAFLTNIPQPRP